MADKKADKKADKTLRIIFSGINTLTPGPPREGEEPPPLRPGPPGSGEKPPRTAFVLMAATTKQQKGGRKVSVNGWGTTIPDHTPFVHVARSLLVDPPWPTETVAAREGGEHWIYFFRDAQVVICPSPKLGIEYFIDPQGRPLADRPGSLDVAPADDVRWLADTRDILSQPAPLKATANPEAKKSVGPEVAAFVKLEGGMLRANFPCDTVHPKAFIDAKGNVIPGLRRVLADEFIIDMSYPKKIEQVTLSFKELRKDTTVTGPPKELVLRWPKGEHTIELRMGNDPEEEVRVLDTPGRFDPVRRIGPTLSPRSDDFDLHYNLLDIANGERPLPQNDINQCRADDCKPVFISLSKPGGAK
jgi:hypothetical protein